MVLRNAASRESEMEKELAWIRRGGKKTGNKARLKNFKELQSRAHQEREIQKNINKGKLIIPPGPRLGDRVVDMKAVSKTFEGRTLFHNVSFVVEPGCVVGTFFCSSSCLNCMESNGIEFMTWCVPILIFSLGVVGGNGVGKSTLLRIIAGELDADEGSVKLGETVQIGFVTQSRLDRFMRLCQALLFPSSVFLSWHHHHNINNCCRFLISVQTRA